jgi:hypothetical protein
VPEPDHINNPSLGNCSNLRIVVTTHCENFVLDCPRLKKQYSFDFFAGRISDLPSSSGVAFGPIQAKDWNFSD